MIHSDQISFINDLTANLTLMLEGLPCDHDVFAPAVLAMWAQVHRPEIAPCRRHDLATFDRFIAALGQGEWMLAADMKAIVREEVRVLEVCAKDNHIFRLNA